MTLLAPLGLALALVAIPIVLMYVLKLRRQERVVSSTILWRRALEDVQANAPWQRLRPNLLLFLQLLALAALVVALAAPAYSRAQTYAGDLIVIIDESYGMQAHDVKPSRFQVALARARQLAAQLGSGNVMSVIGMGAQPRLAIAESSDQSAIDAAIDNLQPEESSPNVLGAVSLAASLARSGEQTQGITLTSRESGIATLPLHVAFPVDVIRIGAQLHDLGITETSAARVSLSPAGRGAHTQLVVRVGNFGYSQARSDLDLFVDGLLADVRPLDVPPGKQVTLFWSDLPGGAQSIRAQIVARDDVSADKNAWAVLPPPIVRHVLLVTRGDYFLQTALSLDPSVSLTAESPRVYGPQDASGEDLVIFEGALPAQLPNTATLLIGPPQGRVGPIAVGGMVPGGTAENASPPSDAALADIVQYANLSDVHVAWARRVSLPGWMQPLVTTAAQPDSSGGTLLMAAGDSGRERVGIITFPIQYSDWPLRISFPVVLESFLHYLAPGLGPNPSNVLAGQPVVISTPSGTRTLQVVRPDGTVVTLRGTPRVPFPPFTDTRQTGLYTVRGAGIGQSALFASNFFPARPAPAFGPAVLHLGAPGAGRSHSRSAPVSVAWLFGLLGLLALSLEWWWAFRR